MAAAGGNKIVYISPIASEYGYPNPIYMFKFQWKGRVNGGCWQVGFFNNREGYEEALGQNIGLEEPFPQSKKIRLSQVPRRG